MFHSKSRFHSKSINVRMVISFTGNVLRASLGVFTGFIVARGLNPVGYGDLMFLITTMTAIQTALQMGSSSAFYTFLSQYSHSIRFYLLYYAWLAIQLITSFVILIIFFPDKMFEVLWFGQSREIVAITILAVFLQKIIWPMIGHIGESTRQTFKVQILNIITALSYLIIISLMYIFNIMSIKFVLYALIGVFTIFIIVSYWYLKELNVPNEKKRTSLKEIIKLYWSYCKPLLILSIAVFLYQFLDRWLLQKYGGSIEQAYYQVAFQISSISLLATTSILNVFWKEIAGAWKNNKEFAKVLYLRINRILVIFSTIVCGLLMPWSEQIIMVFLGNDYIQGWPVLMIMLCYPIHQSMGQVGGAMLLATSNTFKQMLVSVVAILVSIPITYFILAPTNAAFFPGFGLGALGIAIKMLVINIFSVNAQALIISRIIGLKYDWLYQMFGIPFIIGSGFFAAYCASKIIWFGEVNIFTLLLSIGTSLIILTTFVLFIIMYLPWLIGFDKSSNDYFVEKIQQLSYLWKK